MIREKRSFSERFFLYSRDPSISQYQLPSFLRTKPILIIVITL
jgi:hypothetical protein